MMALIADKPAHLQVTLQRNVRSPLLGVPRGVEPRRRLVLQRTFAAVQEAGVGKGGTVKGGSGDTDKPEVYGRSDLYAELASKTGLAPKSAKEVADHVLKIIEHQVGEGKKVALMGFGSFQLRVRPPRKVRNPRTGEETQIGTTVSPAFTPGKSFKTAVQAAYFGKGANGTDE